MNYFKSTNFSIIWSTTTAMLGACLAVPAIIYGVPGFTWQALIVGLILWQVMAIVGITAGVHRYFSHRAFKTSRFWQWAMAYVSMAALNGPPCIWASDHYTHHRFSDTKDDPYLKLAITGATPVRHKASVSYSFLAKKVKEDSLHKLTLQYHWLYVFSYALPLLAADILLSFYNPDWAPWTLFFWGFVFPAGLTQATLRLVLWTGHLFIGYRNFSTKDNSNNFWFMALIAGGEGWHNNHHEYPAAANLRIKWWEFDPGYMFIRLIQK